MEQPPDSTIPANTVLLAYRGSIAHGMYVAPVEPTGIDDKDVIAIYVDQLDRYFGLPSGPARGGHGIYGEWDVETYEFRHLVGLLTNGNPKRPVPALDQVGAHPQVRAAWLRAPPGARHVHVQANL